MVRWGIAVVVAAAMMWPPGLSVAQDQPVTDAAPQPTVEAQLWQVLRLDDLMPILQAEALQQADEMAGMLFERGSDAGWRDRVAAIHQPDRLEGLLRSGLESQLQDAPPQTIRQAIGFYRAPLGQQIAQLDLQGRRAMLDEDTRAGAIAAHRQADAIDAPRLGLIQTLVEGTDLIEQNVASGLNAALAFAQGFAEAGGYTVPMSEAEILADTWAQEDGIRAQTQEWIMAYLYLSYAPLSDDDLRDFVDFALSDAGRLLWDVQMAAFDRVYRTTSGDMGRAAALHMSGRQL